MMVQNAGVGKILPFGYNHPMPTIQRPDRVNIKVSKKAKDWAILVAHVMTTQESRWKETDAWEQAMSVLVLQKEVRDKLSALSDEQKAEIITNARKGNRDALAKASKTEE